MGESNLQHHKQEYITGEPAILPVRRLAISRNGHKIIHGAARKTKTIPVVPSPKYYTQLFRFDLCVSINLKRQTIKLRDRT